MKVSIITLHRSINYGSVLQTYATQKVIEKLGHEVEFVDYCRPNNTEREQIQKTFCSKSIQSINKVTLGLLKPLLLEIVRRRVVKRAIPMNSFLEKYITLTHNRYYSYKDISSSVPPADIYFTGSDQVWNSKWNGGVDKAFFLQYVPEGKRKIAYASSIGQIDVSKEELNIVQSMLKDFEKISVREQSAVELLKTINIDAQLVLDPTLMLDKEEWMSLAQKPNISRPYLLIYQLNQNKEMDKYARKIAEKKGLKVIKVLKNPLLIKKRRGIEYLSLPSVEALIGYFANADMVLTDSFHGTAFSINFNVNFVSVEPPRFGTRLHSILQMLNIENRMLEDYQNYDVCEQPIDWNGVQTIISQKRQESYEFLQNVFKEDNDKGK